MKAARKSPRGEGIGRDGLRRVLDWAARRAAKRNYAAASAPAAVSNTEAGTAPARNTEKLSPSTDTTVLGSPPVARPPTM
jgi:GNAT superfamily N-acetyltransferase